MGKPAVGHAVMARPRYRGDAPGIDNKRATPPGIASHWKDWSRLAIRAATALGKDK